MLLNNDSSNALHLLGLGKSFGKKPVMAPLTERFEPGLHLLKGPNGSGKSTLLRLIGGLLPPSQGDASVDGFHLRKHPLPYRRLVNHASSEGGLPLAVTARDLFAFAAGQKGDSALKAQDLADRLGLGHATGERLAVYSSGMLKKVALVLSLMGPGRVVLWDEPFNALDDGAVDTLADLATGVVDAGGILLVATHVLPGRWPSHPACVGHWQVGDGTVRREG